MNLTLYFPTSILASAFLSSWGLRADSLLDWSEIWGGFFFYKIKADAVTTIAVEREMIVIVDFDV